MDNLEHVGAFSCSICLDENKYLAVGKCNHHICSKCAIRMRIKTKNYCCAICKENLKMMIIFTIPPHKKHQNNMKNKNNDQSLTYPLFQSFEINENDFDIDSYNMPGMRIDPIGNFLYIDCSKHYIEMENLRSIVCPMKQCKLARFHSNDALQKHLNDAHQGLMICHLCLNNRPLFTSEHKVMNKKEFAQHLKGHPQCEFCHENFFDQSTLYNHMQRTYLTCHLCPGQYMFRYYRNTFILQQHYHEAHIVCGICESVPSVVESGVAIAFKDTREYAEHMQQFHRNNTSNGPLTFRIGTTYHAQYNNNIKHNATTRTSNTKQHVVNYVDLEMGTANPYANNNNENPTTNNNTSQNNNANNNSSNNSQRSLIPSHMKIAGRITGTGKFASLNQNDLLMQAIADEEVAAELKESMKKNNQKNLEMEKAFPTLQSISSVSTHTNHNSKISTNNDLHSNSLKQVTLNSSSTTTGSNNSSTTTTAATSASIHPLSIMHASRYNSSKESQRKQDLLNAEKLRKEKQQQEEKRIERNLLLASALLGDQANNTYNSNNNNIQNTDRISFIPLNHSTAQQLKSGLNMATVTASTVGATLRDQTYINTLTSPLLSLGWNTSLLMRTIYPSTLTTWARQHAVELLKIERKLYTLMMDSQMNSVQFKPMTWSMRLIVHQISRMYLLNSYEYDSEPQRYVSVVKQHDSYLPSCTLSKAAAALPIFTIPSITLSMKNTTANTTANTTTTEQEKALGNSHIYLTLNSESFITQLTNTNSKSSIVNNTTKVQNSTSKADNSLRIAFTCAEVIIRFKALLENADIWREWYSCTLQSFSPIKQQQQQQSQVVIDNYMKDTIKLPPGLLGTSSSLDHSFNQTNIFRPIQLSKVIVPQIITLISAGANCIGLGFQDHITAQLAYHYLKFCSLLYMSNNNTTISNSMKEYSSETLHYIQNQIHPSVKQHSELAILNLFQINTSFALDENIIIDLLCEAIHTNVAVSKIVYSRLFQSSITSDNVTSINNSNIIKDVVSKANLNSDYISTIKSNKNSINENEWHYQALKTKLYEDSAITPELQVKASYYSDDLHLKALDNWEDMIDIDSNNTVLQTSNHEVYNENHDVTFATSNSNSNNNQNVITKSDLNNDIHDDVINEEWIQYLAENRKKSQNSSIPKYKPPNRSQQSSDTTISIINSSNSSNSNTCNPNIKVNDYEKIGIKNLDNKLNKIDEIVYQKDYFETEYEFEQYLLKLQELEENHVTMSTKDTIDSLPMIINDEQINNIGFTSNNEVIAVAYHPMMVNNNINHNNYSIDSDNNNIIQPVYAIPIDDDDNNHEDNSLVEDTNNVLRKNKNKFNTNKFGMLDNENDEHWKDDHNDFEFI